MIILHARQTFDDAAGFKKARVLNMALLYMQGSVFERTLQPEMRAHPLRIQYQQTFRTVSSKVPRRRNIMFISFAINRIMVKIDSKMSDQDAIAAFPYAEKDTLG